MERCLLRVSLRAKSRIIVTSESSTLLLLLSLSLSSPSSLSLSSLLSRVASRGGSGKVLCCWICNFVHRINLINDKYSSYRSSTLNGGVSPCWTLQLSWIIDLMWDDLNFRTATVFKSSPRHGEVAIVADVVDDIVLEGGRVTLLFFFFF